MDKNNKMNNHKDLDVWNKSISLVTDIYKLTKDFAKDEIYGLTTQMRSAAVSIPSNIAEGASRNSGKEFIQFLYISLGSASELETQIIISQNLGYLNNFDNYLSQIESVKKMLNGLISHLKRKTT